MQAFETAKEMMISISNLSHYILIFHVVRAFSSIVKLLYKKNKDGRRFENLTQLTI